MRFLPENKTKTILLVAVGGICVIGIMYFLFFFGRQPEIPNDALTTEEAQAVRQSEIMPYGPTFDTDILEQYKAKALRPVPVLEVLPQELGHTNPFVR